MKVKIIKPKIDFNPDTFKAVDRNNYLRLSNMGDILVVHTYIPEEKVILNFSESFLKEK